MSDTLTERQRREQAFYDEYSQAQRDARVDFAPVRGEERRPWNPYWRLFQLVREVYTDGARLLDLGCGWGVNTVRFADLGYQVEGVDISEGNLRATQELAKQVGLADRVSCRREPVEAMSLADGCIDVIAGVDVLHHVEVLPTIRECHRVLKPGGWAFFKEPVEAPLFDTLRRQPLVQRMFPLHESQDAHITHDERKLSAAELREIAQVFPTAQMIPFRVVSRLERLWPGSTYRLERLDRAFCEAPVVGNLRGTVVMALQKG